MPPELLLDALTNALIDVAGGTRAQAPAALGLHSLIACGSAVRTDYWHGQSDIDVIAVGMGAHTPPFGLLPNNVGGVTVDAYRISHDFFILESQRPFAARYSVQFKLHGFDLKQSYRILLGDDIMPTMPVGESLADLTPLIRDRMSELAGYVEQDQQPLSKHVCEALKVAQMYFGMRRAEDPTRNKNHVMDNFHTHVPNFHDKGFADEIWSLYGQGKYLPNPPDGKFDGRCRNFVRQIRRLVSLDSA